MKYQVLILRRAQKILEKIIDADYRKIKNAIAGLAEDPRPPETDSIYMEHVEYIVVNDLGRRDTLTFNLFVNCEYGNPIVANRPASARKPSHAAPFDISTSSSSGSVRFLLSSTAAAVHIYDLTGRQVGRVTPVKAGDGGAYAVWPGPASGSRRIPAGKYFAKVAGEGGGEVKPFLLVR